MFNRNMLAAAIAAAALVSACPAFAAKEDKNTSNGAANGQPFQALQAQIDANHALITANNGSVASLQLQINDLNGRIAALETVVVTMEGDIADNADAIQGALSAISSTESNVQALAVELTVLANKHQFDIELINQLLTDVQAELVVLNAERAALAASLSQQLTALNAAVTDNAVAIDSLLLDLVTVNANLTVLNSNILNLSVRQNALENASGDYADLLADLGARIGSLDTRVETLEGFHLTTFTGIQTNLALSSLSGWSVCHSAPYSAGTHPEDLQAACTGSKIMLACRVTGSDDLTLAAYANREEVFQDTGDSGNTVHAANGVNWYLSGNYSMGFTPLGTTPSRTSADTAFDQGNLRLSWHTHNNGVGGYRCGSAMGLNGSNAWEKVVLQAN